MSRTAFAAAVLAVAAVSGAGTSHALERAGVPGARGAVGPANLAGATRGPVAATPAPRPLSPLLQLYERPGASVDVSLHAPRPAGGPAQRGATPSATVDLPPARRAPSPPPLLRRAPRPAVTIARAPGASSPHVYDAAVSGVARMYGIDPLFMGALVRQESGFHAGAVSPKGASGLMQVMPATARRFGVDGRALQNPVVNLAVGAVYLKTLQRRYGNNLPLVLAAYNAGEGAVNRHGRRVPPYRETRTYVSSILTQYRDGLYAGRSAGR